MTGHNTVGLGQPVVNATRSLLALVVDLGGRVLLQVHNRTQTTLRLASENVLRAVDRRESTIVARHHKFSKEENRKFRKRGL